MDPSRLHEIVAIRRDIHRHPELAFEERRTSELVADHLRGWGVEVWSGIGGTGIVGRISGRGGGGGRAIGLRADMDALPILEATGLPYASAREGVMHACGHDGHTAMLLGAARDLAETRDFDGTVTLIFQPAEEGGRGALAMVEDRLFERFPCEAIYGLHNRPSLPLGRIAARSGAVMANCDRWHVSYRGTGGHGGSTPHLATDVTVAGGQFLVGLHTIVGRNVPANETAVVSVGSVRSGVPEAANVMPSVLDIHGVTRTFGEEVRERVRRRIDALAASLGEAHGCSAHVAHRETGIAVVNTERESVLAAAAAAEVVGSDGVVADLAPSTGGEDFAFMLRHVPGCMAFIGGRASRDSAVLGLHTPTYDFNDDMLPIGVAYWYALARREHPGIARRT